MSSLKVLTLAALLVSLAACYPTVAPKPKPCHTGTVIEYHEGGLDICIDTATTPKASP